MKKTLFLSLLALISVGCNNSAPTPVNTNTTTTSASPVAPKKEDSQTMVAHSSENQKMPASHGDSTSDSSSGGSPMQKPVDVSSMTETIEKAKKEYEAKPNDEKAKEVLATAYFTRAFALTDAAQYNAALGDFRKGLKLNPNDQKAKEMHDQIVTIYQGIGKGVPKEGEEKTPLPYSK